VSLLFLHYGIVYAAKRENKTYAGKKYEHLHNKAQENIKIAHFFAKKRVFLKIFAFFNSSSCKIRFSYCIFTTKVI
jgi:hypothetical protein